MYHIAFFFDYYDLRRKGVPFLRKKLGHFLNDDFSEAYLLKGDNTQLMGIKLSEQALPEPAPYSYDHPWFIHGGLKACDGTVQHPRLSLYTDKSLLDINGLFACLARRFHWVIFPWGGVFPFGIFAFVTTDSGTRDSFVGCTDNFFRMTPWYSSGGARMTRHDMLIFQSCPFSGKHRGDMPPALGIRCLCGWNPSHGIYGVSGELHALGTTVVRRRLRGTGHDGAV